MWEVHGTTRVVKILGRLQKSIRDAVEKGFAILAQNPFRGEALRGYSNLRSLPVTTSGGEYRVVYTIKPEEKVVLVILIGPREGFYERLKQYLG
jgi:mRNA-degrading endonuclease RelE of RelBE toxin-antitoxin system